MADDLSNFMQMCENVMERAKAEAKTPEAVELRRKLDAGILFEYIDGSTDRVQLDFEEDPDEADVETTE